MDPEIDEGASKLTMFNPITFVLNMLAMYGWYLVGAAAVLLYLVHKLRPRLDRWYQEREDAAYHKDPDVALARMQATQAARERQQKLLEEASARALEEQREREQRRRAEALQALNRLQERGGRRLDADDGEPGGYMPLSGGASGSSYRPPRRSACSRGGCGR